MTREAPRVNPLVEKGTDRCDEGHGNTIPEGKESTMGIDDRIENTAEDVKGKGKEAVGKATDDEGLEAEGKVDQAKAGMKNAVEDVKDNVKDALD
jgi:uncharacterized protein YjbJ (UPF0337 family)